MVSTAQIPTVYILSVIWLGEDIEAVKFAGIFFIFAAIIIVIVADLRKEKQEEEEKEERRILGQGVVQEEEEEKEEERGRRREGVGMEERERIREKDAEQMVYGAKVSEERIPLIDRVPSN